MADVTLMVPVNGKGPVDVTQQDPPAGAYEVEIQGADEHKKLAEGVERLSYEFTISIVESGSPALGISTRLYLGADFSKPFNVGHFVNLFTGVMQKLGKSPEEIKAKLAGNVQLPLSSFVGKRAFVYVKAAPDELDAQGRKALADKNFVTLPMYEAAKKTIAALGPPKAPSRTAGAPATNGATGGPGPVPGGPAPVTGGAAGTSAPIGDLFT